MTIQPPSRENIATAFNALRASAWQGISGVHVIDTQKSGPTVGITICTHGNEISGLAVFWYLTEVIRIQKKLKIGRLVFTLNNLHAAEQYFTARTDDERSRARYTDINFNRLPQKLTGQAYEVRRAKKLLPVWQQFDFALDIHSTIQESRPMIIAGDVVNMSLIRGFPIDCIISNIHNIQIGKPAFSWYGTPGTTPVLEIEAGSHENPQSFVCAIQSAISFLQNIGMIAGKVKHVRQTYREYFVGGSIVFPDESYTLTKVYRDFSFVPRETIVAAGKGGALRMPFDGHVLFAPKNRSPNTVSEEVMFLTLPARTLIDM